MPKFNLSIVKNQMLADVLVSKSRGEAEPHRIPARALFDTGATRSCITTKLAATLTLVPVSKARILTANGARDCNMHMADIGFQFPSHSDGFKMETLSEIAVIEISDHPAWEILIGMDVIQRGVLVVEGGTYIFSL